MRVIGRETAHAKALWQEETEHTKITLVTENRAQRGKGHGGPRTWRARKEPNLAGTWRPHSGLVFNKRIS